MKISYYITHFPYDNVVDGYKYGGAEYVAYNLALKAAEKHDVNVFTTSANSKDLIEERNGMRIHRYGTKLRIECGNISPKLFSKPLEYDADIVHAHFSTPPAELAALRYAKKKNVPFVLTYHGDWQENFGSFIRRVTLSCYNRYLLDKVCLVQM